jgi:hypothetical protein
MIAEDRERRDTLFNGDPVFLGDIEIRIQIADVHVHEYIVGFENGTVLLIVEVDVEHLAIAAPVSAEINENAFVGGGRSFQCSSDISMRLRGVRVDVAICSKCCTRKQHRGGDQVQKPGPFHRGESSGSGTTASVCHRDAQPSHRVTNPLQLSFAGGV